MSFNKKATMLAMAMALPLAACDVDQTEQGDLPEVEVQEGELPEYDVEGPEVEMERDTVTVPDMDVTVPENEDVPEGANPDGANPDGGPY